MSFLQGEKNGSSPLIKKKVMTRIWNSLKNFPNDPQMKMLHSDLEDYIGYMERQWSKKSENTNLFNFYRLSRIRSYIFIQ